MSNVLSVLATKDSTEAHGTVNLFKVDAKTAREYVRNHSHASSCFLETIADIDNAHFMTMYEMHDLVRQLKIDTPNLPPRDRLDAAKELAYALREKQDTLPPLSDKPKAIEGTHTGKFFPPSSATRPFKRGTKKALFAEMMLRGTTVNELVQAIGWKPAAVQSGFNYDMNKVHGFGYTIEKKDGVDFYKLVVPAHHHGPLVV